MQLQLTNFSKRGINYYRKSCVFINSLMIIHDIFLAGAVVVCVIPDIKPSPTFIETRDSLLRDMIQALTKEELYQEFSLKVICSLTDVKAFNLTEEQRVKRADNKQIYIVPNILMALTSPTREKPKYYGKIFRAPRASEEFYIKQSKTSNLTDFKKQSCRFVQNGELIPFLKV